MLQKRFFSLYPRKPSHFKKNPSGELPKILFSFLCRLPRPLQATEGGLISGIHILHHYIHIIRIICNNNLTVDNHVAKCIHRCPIIRHFRHRGLDNGGIHIYTYDNSRRVDSSSRNCWAMMSQIFRCWIRRWISSKVAHWAASVSPGSRTIFSRGTSRFRQ